MNRKCSEFKVSNFLYNTFKIENGNKLNKNKLTYSPFPVRSTLNLGNGFFVEVWLLHGKVKRLFLYD